MKEFRSLEHMIRDIVEGNENRNTEIRRKVANVGRPEDNVKDETSKLAKQGEIKTKIIDEDKEWEKDSAAVKASTDKKFVSKMADKWGERGGAFLSHPSITGADKKKPVKEGLNPEDAAKTEPKMEVDDKDDKKKKKSDGGKDDVDAGEIKGGKTEVILDPKTNDIYHPGPDSTGSENDAKKTKKEAMKKAGVKEEAMLKSDKTFGLPADLIAAVTEALKGDQHKIDKNHNGKVDGHDFKILRGETKVKAKPQHDKARPAFTAKEEAEQVELSAEELARLEEISKSFHKESIDEAVKKSEPMATTIVSSPLRGPKQDYSGVTDKHNTADYTISDDKKLKEDASGQMDQMKKQMQAKKDQIQKQIMAKKMAVMQAKAAKQISKIKEEQIDEISDTTLQSYRTKAMAHKASHQPGDSEAVKAERNRKTRNRSQGVRTSWNKMIGRHVKVGGGGKKTYAEEIEQIDEMPSQHRSAAGSGKNTNPNLSKLARKLSMEKPRTFRAPGTPSKAENRAELQKLAAGKEVTKLPPGKAKGIKEESIEEAQRGRPKKNPTAEDPGSENIIMQLRKVITLRGQEPVKFADGRSVKLSPAAAHSALAKYDNLRTSGEKHAFSMRLHKSMDSMRDAIMGKAEPSKPKISLAGKITGTQKEE